ncbi:HEAT repeat domain-containing protein [Actinomadura barringtoniae]|uniref:HEAT repeat domain-containing protein n=1 Tax=Actinomadura barringtoniae TaxID=1427535 RepID=A0A939T8W6_9ACTN|nr:HEAT repeat domain-containing protein [Actinomadura barringtoniae]MBO2450757.1 HEAT repeat domain-containing protein [Actinomadura barringtoniae]
MITAAENDSVEGDLRERLDRIARKAADLELNPPLPIEDVEAFEQRNGIRLPEGYRAFITTLGNGGPGPYEGLEPLDPHLTTHKLAANFPCGPEDLNVFYRSSQWGHWSGYLGTLLLNRQGDMEWDYHETARPRTLLVVSGPGRGRMVMVEADDEYFSPIYHPAPDFLAWYEEWLDGAKARSDERKARPTLRPETDFDRPGWTASVVRDHPDPEEAVWAARMIAARWGRWDWPNLSEPGCRMLAEAATNSASPLVRATAVWALKSGGPDGTRLAVPALRDPDPKVRQTALTTLTWMRKPDEEATEAIRSLADDPEPTIRIAVASRLGTEQVIADHLDHPDARVRVAAVRALPTLQFARPGPRHLPLFRRVQAMIADPDPAVRAVAVHAFAWDKDARWEGMVMAAAVTDPDRLVRREAASDLLRSQRRTGLIPILSVLLEDEDPAIRWQTLYRLARGSWASIKIPSRFWATAAHARLTDPEPGIRTVAIDTLVQAGAAPPPEEWPPLIEDPDAELRSRACRCAAKVAHVPGDPLHRALHGRLADPERDVRSGAASGLEKACTSECRDAIEAAHEAEPDRVVAYVLSKILDRITPR